MRLDTKFDIGQTVWLISSWGSGWSVDRSMKIYAIEYDGLIVYHGNCGPQDWWAGESFCFSSRKTAQEECDRRNTKGEGE